MKTKKQAVIGVATLKVVNKPKGGGKKLRCMARHKTWKDRWMEIARKELAATFHLSPPSML